MPEGQVLATAIIRFVADDTQYQTARAGIVGASSQMAGAVSTVATAQEDAARTANRAAVATLGLGTVTKEAAPAASILGDATRQTHKELFEAERLTRSFTNAIGAAIPGLSSMTGHFTRLGRETQGFSVGQVAMTTGLLAIAVVVGEVIKEIAAATEEQIKLNVATASFDSSAIEGGLQAAVTGYRTYEERAAIAADSNNSFITRAITGFPLIIPLVTQLATGVDTVAEKVQINAEAWLKNWAAVGQFKDESQATLAVIGAMTASLELQRQTATSPQELAAIGQKEADLAIQRANIASQQIVNASLVKQAELDGALTVLSAKLTADQKALDAGHGSIEAVKKDEADLAGLVVAKQQIMADTAQTAAAKRQEGEINASKAIIKARQDEAAVAAKQIEDEAKIADVYAEQGIASAKAALAEADARQSQITATQNYYGQSLTGLQSYQSQRLVAVEAELQQEIDRVNARYAAELQAEILRRDALPIYSNQWKEENSKIDLLAATHAKTISGLQDQMAQSAIDGQGKITEATRAEQARRLELEGATFKLAQAQGEASVADELTFAARRVMAWQESGTKRLQAETEFANQVKKLHDEIANVGASLEDRAIAALKEEGILAGTRYDVEQKMVELHQQDLQFIAARNAGGVIDFDNISKVRAAAKDELELAKLHVTPTQAVELSWQNTSRHILGVRDTTGILVDDMDHIGAVSGDTQAATAQIAQDTATWRDNTQGVTTGFEGITGSLTTVYNTGLEALQAIDAMIEAGRQWNEQQRTMDTTGAQFQDTFTRGFDESLAAIDGFFDQADVKVREGNSRLADTIYQGLIDRLKNAIDAEALAS